MGAQALGTGVFGPVPKDSIGLILGQSSALLKGINVHPGVIDNNHSGEVKVLVEATAGILAIPRGEKLARLILLSSFNSANPLGKQVRAGGKRFNSSNCSKAFWLATLEDRPALTLTIKGKRFAGLADTGADSSVLAKLHWPASWPLEPAHSSLQGMGVASSPERNVLFLKWEDAEGHSGVFKPYVLEHLPINLWGRDMLQAMGAVLTTEPIQKALANQNPAGSRGLDIGFLGNAQAPAAENPSQRLPKQHAGNQDFCWGPL